MRILISGSTGFVGTALVQYLTGLGHEVVPLVRSQPRSGAVYWNPETGEIEADKLENMDAAVHLAGASIAASRWTSARKTQIRDSRIRGTKLLSESLAKLAKPPQVLVSGSAIGYYGDRGSEVLREDSKAGIGFLAEVCKAWEASTEPAERRGIRVAHLRTGIVLGPHGGALSKMLLPFKMGVGGRVGSGQQYMSWIALSDECAAIYQILQNADLKGPVNSVAPNPVTNIEFTKTLGRVLRRPTIFPLPAFAAKTALGEMAEELLLASQRVQPTKLSASGFVFKYKDLESALRNSL